MNNSQNFVSLVRILNPVKSKLQHFPVRGKQCGTVRSGGSQNEAIEWVVSYEASERVKLPYGPRAEVCQSFASLQVPPRITMNSKSQLNHLVIFGFFCPIGGAWSSQAKERWCPKGALLEILVVLKQFSEFLVGSFPLVPIKIN